MFWGRWVVRREGGRVQKGSKPFAEINLYESLRGWEGVGVGGVGAE